MFNNATKWLLASANSGITPAEISDYMKIIVDGQIFREKLRILMRNVINYFAQIRI